MVLLKLLQEPPQTGLQVKKQDDERELNNVRAQATALNVTADSDYLLF